MLRAGGQAFRRIENSLHTFAEIRNGGGVGHPPPPPPPPPTIFEGRNLPQQVIRHWKGNLSKSPIHFRYLQNILISRLYEHSREMTLQWLQKNFKLLKYEHIIYHFKAHNLEIQLI